MSKYNVGDKFTIEIKELINGSNDKMLYKSDCYSIIFSEEQLDKLQKYEEVQIPYSEAYNKGLEDGRNDAWKLANKIADTLTTSERARIFNYVVGGITVVDILRDFAPQEALAKLEAYEKANEIKVGDVVTVCGEKGIVVGYLCGLEEYEVWMDGYGRPQRICKNEIKKTGKHIDIQSVLEQIKE